VLQLLLLLPRLLLLRLLLELCGLLLLLLPLQELLLLLLLQLLLQLLLLLLQLLLLLPLQLFSLLLLLLLVLVRACIPLCDDSRHGSQGPAALSASPGPKRHRDEQEEEQEGCKPSGRTLHRPKGLSQPSSTILGWVGIAGSGLGGQGLVLA